MYRGISTTINLSMLRHGSVMFRYIDSRAENGLTALHLAAVSGSLESVRLLLDAGASMMVRTVDLDVISEVIAPAGSTPLHVAAMTGHVSILQAMLQVHGCIEEADVIVIVLLLHAVPTLYTQHLSACMAAYMMPLSTCMCLVKCGVMYILSTAAFGALPCSALSCPALPQLPSSLQPDVS